MTAIFLQTIERARRELPGTFAVCAEQLDGEPAKSSTRLAWNESTSFPAASVIKVAVALELLCAIEEGSIAETERLVVRDGDGVVGSGVLASLEAGLRLPILDVLYLSLAISDNTAANLLIGRTGVAAVNARLASLGLVTTRLTGKLMVKGEDGELSPTSAAELVTLLREVHLHERLPARACERLLALLARTQTASTIGRGLPDERFPGVGPEPRSIRLAYKTGSIRGVIAEAGIVTTPRATYAIALLSEGSPDLRPNHDNIGRVILGDVSRAIYETMK